MFPLSCREGVALSSTVFLASGTSFIWMWTPHACWILFVLSAGSVLSFEKGICISEDELNCVSSTVMTVTLLVSGFIIGPGGVSIRAIQSNTGTQIMSWTQSMHGYAVRMFSVQVRAPFAGFCEALPSYMSGLENRWGRQKWTVAHLPYWIACCAGYRTVTSMGINSNEECCVPLQVSVWGAMSGIKPFHFTLLEGGKNRQK